MLKEVSMDFSAALKNVFLDKAWFRKFVVLMFYGLIPFLGVLVIGGWGLKVGKMVIDGNDAPVLPKVEFSADLWRGFLASLIDLIYALPATIFFTVTVVLTRFGFNAEGFSRGLLMILAGSFGLFGLLLFVLWFLVATPAFANFLAKDRFRAAFNFRQLFELLRNSFGSWMLVILGQVLAMMIIAPVGIVLFGIGLLFTTAYGAVFYSHLLGQAYLKSTS